MFFPLRYTEGILLSGVNSFYINNVWMLDDNVGTPSEANGFLSTLNFNKVILVCETSRCPPTRVDVF